MGDLKIQRTLYKVGLALYLTELESSQFPQRSKNRHCLTCLAFSLTVLTINSYYVQALPYLREWTMLTISRWQKNASVKNLMIGNNEKLVKEEWIVIRWKVLCPKGRNYCKLTLNWWKKLLFLGEAARSYLPGMWGMKSRWPAEVIIKIHCFWKEACLGAHSTLPAWGAGGKE